MTPTTPPEECQEVLARDQSLRKLEQQILDQLDAMQATAQEALDHVE